MIVQSSKPPKWKQALIRRRFLRDLVEATMDLTDPRLKSTDLRRETAAEWDREDQDMDFVFDGKHVLRIA